MSIPGECVTGESAVIRCPWCGTDPLYITYHDTEWGVPCRDERRLFEFLILEGMQAGLSWLTILRKRENFRRAFSGFDPGKIARYGDRDVARLLADPGIVRNRLKIDAAIGNARATLALHEAGGSLASLLWQHVEGKPVINRWRTADEVPVFTPTAQALSKALSQRGFRFVGPTIVYALMQATGLVNDHLVSCPVHPDHRTV
ncbi:DNA-3-methyladenine glycosylase I [Sulfuricystis multivorans]|uniref:DNA-3-methyladenine glycosylase I n=1 Tax=Sulfuricystis multivorans TaxID=2211108 RepID=UPI000F81B2FD|nr:DNA-3-methyladenine glycosylase I [Sulfuricystis multivorans]